MGHINNSNFKEPIGFEESEKKSVLIENGNSENELKSHLENELVVETVSAEIEKSKAKQVRNSYKVIYLMELIITPIKSSISVNIAEKHSTKKEISIVTRGYTNYLLRT